MSYIALQTEIQLKGRGDLDHDLCPQGHLLVIRNIHTMFEGPSPNHCPVISLFCTRGHCDLDLCHVGQLLVKTNIPSKFKVSGFKRCQILSFSVLKVMVTLTIILPSLVRTNIPSEGPSPKHCKVIKLFRVLMTLTFALRIIYW